MQVGIRDEKLRNLTKTIYLVNSWGRIQSWNTLIPKSGYSWLCYLDSKALNSGRISFRPLKPRALTHVSEIQLPLIEYTPSRSVIHVQRGMPFWEESLIKVRGRGEASRQWGLPGRSKSYSWVCCPMSMFKRGAQCNFQYSPRELTWKFRIT